MRRWPLPLQPLCVSEHYAVAKLSPLERPLLARRTGNGFVDAAEITVVLSENHIRTYWWCSPARTGIAVIVPNR